MKISFVLPSMSRPNKFFESLDNLQEMCLSENYEVICLLEETDPTMNSKEVKKRIYTYPFAKPFFINSTGKVNAINQGLDYVSKNYEILILIADDIRFTMKGFDSFIEEHMAKFYPQLDGCLHYPEPAVNDRQITMPVLGRKLIEHWGYIYHKSYISLWCDTEMLSVLKIMRKVTYINITFFKHLHPAWGLAENDALYLRNEAYYQTDSDNYFKRLAINFDL